MTPHEARVRARVWSDVPTIRNIGFIGGLVLVLGGFAAKWGPLPAQVERNTRGLADLRERQASDGRKIGFMACRLADSTINQCLHHYTEP